MPSADSVLSRILRTTVVILGFGPLSVLAQISPPKAEPPAGENRQQRVEVVKLTPYTIEEKRVVDWNSQMTFSGSRTATALLDTPSNITILTSDYLKDIGAVNLVQALQFGGSGVTKRLHYSDVITIRGFRQQVQRDGLNLFINGLTPFYDIERVEILKGPQAVVFSNYGSIGGSVNYVTKRPTAVPMGDMEISVGSFDTYIASVTQRGPLTRDGSVRYRLTGGFQESDGWMGQDQPGANIYRLNRLISGSIDWTVNSRLEMRLDFSRYYERQRDFGRGIIDPVTRKLWAGSAAGYSISTEWAARRWESDWVTLDNVFRATDDFTIRVRGHAAKSHYEYRTPRPDGTTIGPAGLRAAEAPNYQTIGMRALWYIEPRTRNTVEIDASWNKSFGAVKNQFATGAVHESTDDSNVIYVVPLQPTQISGPVSSRPRPPELSSGGWTLNTDNSAGIRQAGWTAYVTDSATLLDGRLIASAGMRYVFDSATVQVGKTALVPAAGVVYKVRPTVSVYAGYGEAYTPRTGFDVFQHPLRDTTGTNMEAGVKFNAFDERLFGSVAYFDVMNDPVLRQVSVVDPVTGFVLVGNADVGKEVNKGWEADVGWVQPFTAGMLSTMASAYLANPKSSAGLQPSSAVKEKYTLFSKFLLTSGRAKGIQVSGGVYWVGEAPGTGFPLHPAHSLIQVNLAYQVKRWALRLQVDNVEDKRGIITNSESIAQIGVNDPRSFRLTYTRAW